MEPDKTEVTKPNNLKGGAKLYTNELTGETKTVKEWSEASGGILKRVTIIDRINNLGWPVSRAVTEPPNVVGRNADLAGTSKKINPAYLRGRLVRACSEYMRNGGTVKLLKYIDELEGPDYIKAIEKIVLPLAMFKDSISPDQLKGIPQTVVNLSTVDPAKYHHWEQVD